MSSKPSEPRKRLPKLSHPRFRGLLLALGLNGVAQAAVLAANALLVARGFDLLFAADADLGSPGVLGVLGGFAGAAAALAALRVHERSRTELLGQIYVHRLRLRLWDQVYAIPWRTFVNRRRGSLLLRFTHDMSALRLWISRGIVASTVGGLTVVGILGALAFLSPLLAVSALVVVTAGAMLSATLGRTLRARALQARKERARLANDVEERLGRLAVVQAFDQGKRERRRLRRRSSRLVAASVAFARAAGGHRAVGDLTGMLATLAILVVGGYEVSQGRASHGAAVSALLMSRMLVRPLRRISRAHEAWHRAAIARERIEALLAQPAPLRDKKRTRSLPDGQGRLTLRRVSIPGVLRRASARAEAGSRIFLGGGNGSGKTSLLFVMAGLEHPGSGMVALDGRDLSRCSLSAARRAVGIVSPDLPLMRGTVLRNLRYRWPGAPGDEVERVTRLCGLRDTLPELDARVADGGANLSTGQRQRLTLARAIVGTPRLLLLDEPESFLDPDALEILREVVSGYPGTVVWASPREGLPMTFDLAWRIADRRLLADQLLEENENEDTGDNGASVVSIDGHVWRQS